MFLALAYTAVFAALASGIIALAASRRPVFMKISSFALLGLSGLCALVAGVWNLVGKSVLVDQLALGLPWLHWHVRLDPLSGFFLAIIGLVTFAISIYGPAYVREYRHGKQPLAVLLLFTGLFIAGMMLVVLADDALTIHIALSVLLFVLLMVAFAAGLIQPHGIVPG